MIIAHFSMKKSICFRMMPALAIGLLVLFTACKQEKPLQLQGEWQEESYYTPNDTIAADTLIRTYTLRHIIFDCNGYFFLKLNTYHDSIEGDPALGTTYYTEYVKGRYSTTGKSIKTEEGHYYTDGSYSVIADSNNTLYSYGEYQLDGTFKLDDKRLILTPTATENTTHTTFAQIGEPFDCFE